MPDQSKTFNDQSGADVSGDTVHIVDANNPQSLNLLTRAYKDVYKKAFGPDEREPMEDWIEAMNGGNKFCNMCIVLLGENLNSGKPVLKGISVGYYYPDQDAGLLGYTVINQEYKTPELDQAMMDTCTEGLQDLSKKNGGKMQSVFIEVDNPAKMEDDDARFIAVERLRSMQSMGAKLVNIDFVEPPLYEGGDKNEALRLLAYPGKAGFLPDAQEVKDVITGLYTGLAECAGMAPKDNPDYKSAMQQIDSATDLLKAPSAGNIAPVERKKVLRFNL